MVQNSDIWGANRNTQFNSVTLKNPLNKATTSCIPIFECISLKLSEITELPRPLYPILTAVTAAIITVTHLEVRRKKKNCSGKLFS